MGEETSIKDVVPFAQDPNLRDAVLEIMRSRKLRVFVETGTNQGRTSGWMAAHGFEVYTCETNGTRYKFAQADYGHMSNWHAVCEDSSRYLPRLLAQLKEPALWFLDAHWGAHWPILDELRAISRAKVGVIVIHDFKVPGKSCGFDSYGHDLDLEYIGPVMAECYKSWELKYHGNPAGPHNRGAAIIDFANAD